MKKTVCAFQRAKYNYKTVLVAELSFDEEKVP